MEGILDSKLVWTAESLGFVVPEILLSVSIIVFIVAGLVFRRPSVRLFMLGLGILFVFNVLFNIIHWINYKTPVPLFTGVIRSDDFSASLRILFDFSGILTVILSLYNENLKRNANRVAEYCALIIALILGAHILVMSNNILMVFIALEMISISSYVLTGFITGKTGSEGSLKFFLFGAVSSAIMLYGFSLIYGCAGTLDFSSTIFFENLLHRQSMLLIVGGILSLAGYLFKIAGAPMHIWAPDVYEAAPMPVLALMSAVPKIAGVAALTKFMIALNLFGQSEIPWKMVLVIITFVTIGIGNFTAILQRSPRRMMAYSSIAQSGFLLIGPVAFSMAGLQFFIFYAFVYSAMNFLVFLYLQKFEQQGVTEMKGFSGKGLKEPYAYALLLAGLIGLAGIPPTGGFTGKLFIFTALWDTYQTTGSQPLMWLLVFGLLNTVVSLFYYLRIPYFAFLKPEVPVDPQIIVRKEVGLNLFALFLVILIIGLFIRPDMLMGWLNSINFVL